MIVIDSEVYTNYYLLSALHVATGKVLHYESWNDSPLDIAAIKTMMQKNITVSFNGLHFDLPILAYKMQGATNAQAKAMCDTIIKSKQPSYKVCNQLGVKVPTTWDHIDTIEVAPGKSGLKIYGGRLHCHDLQDLPFTPGAVISATDCQKLRDYCENDLRLTLALYRTLEKQIDLRSAMSKQYGMDLRSKSDAQIAEIIIVSEIEQLTKKKVQRADVPDGQVFRYRDPGIVAFKTELLQSLFTRILETRFALGASGSIELPAWLKDADITIGKTRYQIGIGGLHSCEKSRAIFRQPDEILADFDVASYYPSIILQQRLAPDSMGAPFLKIYQSIVDRRMVAKKSGDKVTADTLKICVNGSFGKTGSKYSTLYAPELLIQTTITGQLALLMLIESLELSGLSVVSANTDGIVVHTKKVNDSLLEEITFDWMMSTSFELERQDYSALASRDVNNYVALKTNGSYKGKGIFADGGLAKNPDFSIVARAVAEHVATGIDPADVIRASTDIREFVTLRKVTGGAIWRQEYLGKVVRFYYSTRVAHDECIRYAENTNKVPKSDGAMPIMLLPETMPDNVDYLPYIEIAQKLCCEVGL